MPVMIRCRIAVIALLLALAPLQAAHAFEQQGGAPIKISYAASSLLAKGIESGAPADIFISADLDWMDYAQKRNLIQPASRRNLLGNKLVFVAPAGSGVKVDIKPGLDLVGMLKGGRWRWPIPTAYRPASTAKPRSRS